ncbi:MAG: GtrA family protein [Zoogloeaceae bacterium]|nr:GtrA family protein [Rhodocyclaceae bacterium]MCP5234932.1 GtrA family protein [Zoogloeaceae bacterium]
MLADELGRAYRFALVGALNTAVGLGLIFLAKYAAGFGDGPANAIGYSVAFGLSFTVNRSWTFRHSGAWRLAFARSLVVVGGAYACNLATVLGLIASGVQADLAQASGVVPYVLVSYAGFRCWAFRTTSGTG